MTITVDLPEGHLETTNRELALALIEALQAESKEPEDVRHVIVLPDDEV